eukprot:gene17960-biopygen6874
MFAHDTLTAAVLLLLWDSLLAGAEQSRAEQRRHAGCRAGCQAGWGTENRIFHLIRTLCVARRPAPALSCTRSEDADPVAQPACRSACNWLGKVEFPWTTYARQHSNEVPERLCNLTAFRRGAGMKWALQRTGEELQWALWQRG